MRYIRSKTYLKKFWQEMSLMSRRDQHDSMTI